MTALTYTDRELARLEDFGRRRTVEALVDFSQTHLTEFETPDTAEDLHLAE